MIYTVNKSLCVDIWDINIDGYKSLMGTTADMIPG